MANKLNNLTLLLLPVLQMTPAVYAAESGSVSNPNQLINVNGVQADGRYQSTAAKVIVNREELLRYGDSTLAEALKRQPGITIGGAAGQGGEIRMRGLGSGYTQVLLNGEPPPPGFSLDTLDPGLLERVEIVRAATAETGAQAIAGTVNIILRKRVERGQREVKPSLTQERGHTSASVNGQVGGKDGALSYLLVAALGRSEYDRASLAEQVGSDDNGAADRIWRTNQTLRGHVDSLSLAPRLSWRRGGDTVTSESFLGYRYADGRAEEQIVTVLGTPPAHANNLLPYHSSTLTARSSLDWDRPVGDMASLKVKMSASYTQRESWALFEGYDANGAFALRRLNDSPATEIGFSFSGKYQAPYAEHHRLAVGWLAEHSDRTESRVEREDYAGGGLPQLLDEDYDTRVRRLALYAQDEWEINPQWSSYLGMRWEVLDVQSAGNTLPETSNRSKVLSPLMQLLWKRPGGKKDQVRWGLSRTYKAPQMTDLMPRRYIANNNSAMTPSMLGNPGLRPELAWGLDMAYEHYLCNGGLLSASGFTRRIDDVMLTTLRQVNGEWISQVANRGQATVNGIELEAKFKLRECWPAAPGIDVRVNLARNWSRVDAVPGPDNRLDKQVPVSANLGLDYRFGRWPLTIGGNYNFQGGGATNLIGNQSSYSTPKRILDIYGYWRYSDTTLLRVTLSNILHQDSTVVAGYRSSTGATRQATTSMTSTALRVALEFKL